MAAEYQPSDRFDLARIHLEPLYAERNDTIVSGTLVHGPRRYNMRLTVKQGSNEVRLSSRVVLVLCSSRVKFGPGVR